MNLRKLLMAGLLSSGILLGSGTIASAKDFGSELTIDVKATTVNVTVPSTAPMIFNEDGTDTLPSSFTVKNNSKVGGVNLKKVALTAGSSGWTLLDSGADLKTQPKDQKKIKLYIGKKGSEKLIAPATSGTTGSASFGASEIAIPATGSETLSFKVERGTFSQAVPNSTAFNMTLSFEFN